jgi:hypothetical protein
MTQDNEPLLVELEARLQIHDVLVRLGQGVDRLDRDLIISCYHEDAIDNHGAFVGSREGFADWVIGRHTGHIESCMHFLGNEYVVVDGDQARCESYVVAFYRFLKDGRPYDMTAPGRYLDKFEKREGRWKIIDRLVIFEKDRLDPVIEKSVGPLTEMLQVSRRDDADAAYQFFGRTRNSGTAHV